MDGYGEMVGRCWKPLCGQRVGCAINACWGCADWAPCRSMVERSLRQVHLTLALLFDVLWENAPGHAQKETKKDIQAERFGVFHTNAKLCVCVCVCFGLRFHNL